MTSSSQVSMSSQHGVSRLITYIVLGEVLAERLVHWDVNLGVHELTGSNPIMQLRFF